MCVLRWVLWLKVEGHNAHLKHFEIILLSKETVFAISSGKGSWGITIFAMFLNQTTISIELLFLIIRTDRNEAAFLGGLRNTYVTEFAFTLSCHSRPSLNLKKKQKHSKHIYHH